MKNLLKYIHSLTEFSEESWQILLPALTKINIKKGEFLLKENEVCNSLFFIDKGYCRSYYLKDGFEKNTAFNFEGEVVTNLKSFANGEKSDYFIKACVPMEIVIFDKQKLFQASKEAPEIELLGKKCLRLTAAKLEEHANLFKLYSTQEHYEFLERNRPEFLQRVSQTQLSSYLGVSRETISRIRKRRL